MPDRMEMLREASERLIPNLKNRFSPEIHCRVTGARFQPIKDTDTLYREREEAAELIAALTAALGLTVLERG